jgi:hypothetical protein
MMHHQEKAAEEYALALLYQEDAQVILTYLDRRLSMKEDAEDLLLEVFLAALENQGWMTPRSGEQVSPPTVGSKGHPPITAAPGTYVIEKGALVSRGDFPCRKFTILRHGTRAIIKT